MSDAPANAAFTDRLRVVLISPRNPLNIGAAARAMSNFGFADLRVVNPYDVAFREAKSAVRAHYILERAQVHASVSEAIAGCSLVIGTTAVGHRDLHAPLYRLEAGAQLLREHLASAEAALLFGSEKFGLSNEDLSYCRWLLRIPARAEHGSMNLGQAVAISLYELIRDEARIQDRFPQPAAATAEDLERITGMMHEILDRSGYINERTSKSTELKLRRLVLRLGIPQVDAETWLGILRQVLWKLKQE
ncbi:MAG: RNA methyltransferase [Acidobacteriaceae bacterium]|nr:RNA methyltransferase [Acidobacteriaceae bacterium]